MLKGIAAEVEKNLMSLHLYVFIKFKNKVKQYIKTIEKWLPVCDPHKLKQYFLLPCLLLDCIVLHNYK